MTPNYMRNLRGLTQMLLGDSSSRDRAIQVNFDEIEINTIEISPLEELSKKLLKNVD